MPGDTGSGRLWIDPSALRDAIDRQKLMEKTDQENPEPSVLDSIVLREMASRPAGLIPAYVFGRCAVCCINRREILAKYPKKAGEYYLHRFVQHLKVHKLDLRTYCRKQLEVNWPKCPITGKLVGYVLRGTGVVVSHYARFSGVTKAISPSFAAACERSSAARKGAGNPMYGRTPWNKGLDENDPRILHQRVINLGKTVSAETRAKQRAKRAASPLKARHTTHHSEATRAKLSELTAALYKEGKIVRITSIHKLVIQLLTGLKIDFEKEHTVGPYSIDAAIPSRMIALEVDGDYYHCNPIVYPNGPKYAVQRNNMRRDKAKNAYLKNHGWQVLRYWESDIRLPGFAAKLKNDLITLGVLAA